MKKQVGRACRRAVVPTVYGCTMVVVVDEDIDVSDFNQLMWAMVTRCDPESSIDILRRMRSTPGILRLTPEQRKVRDFTNSRMVVDATRPYEWREKFPRVNAPSAGNQPAKRARSSATCSSRFRIFPALRAPRVRINLFSWRSLRALREMSYSG